ncbi:MAG TPA: chromate transporter [Candidatus Butyricicoccus avicola]|nr:chromate transporter [Candidatus Butyricicoccus avicola]
MIYIQLLWSFIQIGLFSIGGGYASLPLIEHQVVDVHGWLTASQLTDIVTISQMTPGPIALNAATFVGTRIGGLPGAIVATLGCVLPSCIIVLALAWVYTKYKDLGLLRGILAGLRPAVVALIASAGLTILISALFVNDVLPHALSDVDGIAVVLFVLSLVILRKWKPDPILVMVGSGVIGAIAVFALRAVTG